MEKVHLKFLKLSPEIIDYFNRYDFSYHSHYKGKVFSYLIKWEGRGIEKDYKIMRFYQDWLEKNCEVHSYICMANEIMIEHEQDFIKFKLAFG